MQEMVGLNPSANHCLLHGPLSPAAKKAQRGRKTPWPPCRGRMGRASLEMAAVDASFEHDAASAINSSPWLFYFGLFGQEEEQRSWVGLMTDDS